MIYSGRPYFEWLVPPGTQDIDLKTVTMNGRRPTAISGRTLVFHEPINDAVELIITVKVKGSEFTIINSEYTTRPEWTDTWRF